MQHYENKYITLARINEINYCFQSYSRRIQRQARQNLLSYYGTIQRKLQLKHFELES